MFAAETPKSNFCRKSTYIYGITQTYHCNSILDDLHRIDALLQCRFASFSSFIAFLMQKYECLLDAK